MLIAGRKDGAEHAGFSSLEVNSALPYTKKSFQNLTPAGCLPGRNRLGTQVIVLKMSKTCFPVDCGVPSLLGCIEMKAAVGSGSEIGEFGRPAKLGIRIFACVMITVMPSQGQPEEEGGMADESVLLMEEMADMRDNLREELHAYREELRSEGFSKREISIATARFREANQAAYDWLRESKQSLVDLRHELDGAPRPPEARSRRSS